MNSCDTFVRVALAAPAVERDVTGGCVKAFAHASDVAARTKALSGTRQDHGTHRRVGCGNLERSN